jgi:hypothetical protein
MSAVRARGARLKTPKELAELLVAGQLAARRKKGLEPPEPIGDLADAHLVLQTIADRLRQLLTGHIERLVDQHPQQATRWDSVKGEMVPAGPAPRPFDPGEDVTAVLLATLIGSVETLEVVDETPEVVDKAAPAEETA